MIHILSFMVVQDGDDTEADSGTSASTPAAAAVISLLNDYLISKRKPPLGFLNPFLYSKGHSGARICMKLSV